MQGAADQRQQAATEMAKPLPSAPHARLLQMIQGLSAAVAGSGAQWASRGKVSGAEVTNQILAQEAQQRENQQKLAMEQKQQDVQNHLAIGASNEATANMMVNLMSLKQRMTQSDLEMKGETQTQAIAGADFQATHMGMKPDEFSSALSGTAPAAGGRNTQMFQSHAQQVLDAATPVLGADDKFVQGLKTVLANPDATPKDLWQATSQLESQQAYQEKAQAGLRAKEAADPLYKMETDPTQIAGEKSAAAIPVLRNMLAQETDPARKSRETHLIAAAQSAHTAYLADQQSQENARVAAMGSVIRRRMVRLLPKVT